GQFATFTVPTAAERSGDFSQDLTAAGQLRVIYNPFTTRPNSNSAGASIRDPFPGNIIPASLINPVAKAAMAYYPASNLPGLTNTQTTTLGITSPAISPTNRLDFKIDQNFTDTKRLFVRYNYLKETSGTPNFWGNPAYPSTGSLPWSSHNTELDYTQTIG